MDILASGTIIGGKYAISELLGSGGMGHVYHARHIAIPEFEVAIKILDPAFTTTVENKDRFRNEVLAGYRASHPNIVQMYEYFDLGTVQAFAMEYVNCGTLHEAMQDGPLPIELALSFIKQIALALSAFHRVGTIHRDLKPANVLLTENGITKLTDFGIAKVRGGSRFEDGGLLAGTPKYAPPEYVEHGDADHRGDIYALGVVGYELLSGNSPFSSDTNTSLLKERMEARGYDLHLLPLGIPREVSAIIERCMAREPLQRFPHAIDVADAVRKIQSTYSLPEPEEVESDRRNTRFIWQALLEQEPNREVQVAYHEEKNVRE
jgi:serine/threonine-protein kinase